MPKITPFLWFDDQAEAAMDFYTSIFKDSLIINISRYGDAGPGKPGAVMSGMFRLGNQEFMALNGGPEFTFSQAISFFVRCKTQQEVDEFWNKLSAGGEQQNCGWVKDKFGVSWQIVPDILSELLNDPNPLKAQSVMRAMLKMRKLVIKDLQRAYEKA